MVALVELVDIKGGGTPSKKVQEYWGGPIPWASVKDFKSTIIESTMDSITKLGVENSATNVIPKGTIVVPTRMAVGKVAVLATDMAINQDLKALLIRDECQLDKRYLLRYLESQSSHILKHAKGATVKGITLDVLRDLDVPLPPLKEQKRIAAILDKADNLRRKRQQAIQLADKFLRAVFLDMFGDPVMNPKGWDTVDLGSVLESIDSGSSPKCEGRAAEADEWGVLKLGSVSYCRYQESENKAVFPDYSPNPEYEVKSGDLLFTRKNTYDLVAATALVGMTRHKLLLPDLIFRLNTKSCIEKYFLWKLLTHTGMRKKVQSLASGAAGSMPNISKANLKTVRIILPPKDRQEEFKDICMKISSLLNKNEFCGNLGKDLFRALSSGEFLGSL